MLLAGYQLYIYILLRVYLPAIEGHIPDNVVHTFHASFLEFCYLVCRDIITDDMLAKL